MSKFQIEASIAYGLTKPGEVQYSSENYRAHVTLTEEVEAGNIAEAQSIAQVRMARLAQDVKLAVINEAGLTARTDENGVVHPVFQARAIEAPAQVQTNVTPILSARSAPAQLPPDHFDGPQYAQGVPVQQGQGGGGGRQLLWDGQTVTVYDNRPKKASGEHKPTAADFQMVFPSGERKPFWIKNKNGSVNQAALRLAAEFGG